MTLQAQSAVPLLCAEDLAALSGDATRHELVEGILIEMSRPKPRHRRTAARLAALVGTHVTAHGLGEVFTESGFVLSRNPDTVRGPDLAFVAQHRVPSEHELDTYFNGAPDLAVEIVSPNDTAIEVRELIDQYMAAGAQLVWIIFPMFKTIEVHRPNQTVEILRLRNTLDGEQVLPGFQMPIARLFE